VVTLPFDMDDLLSNIHKALYAVSDR